MGGKSKPVKFFKQHLNKPVGLKYQFYPLVVSKIKNSMRREEVQVEYLRTIAQ